MSFVRAVSADYGGAMAFGSCVSEAKAPETLSYFLKFADFARVETHIDSFVD